MNSITKQSYLQKILKNISFQHEGFRQFSERYLQNLSTSALKRLKPSDIKELLNEGWTFLQSWTHLTPHAIPKVAIQNLSSLTPSTERGTVIQLLLSNMPFVIDSINTEIRRQGYDVNFMLKGTFNVTRENGILIDVHANGNGHANEMLVHIELRQQLDIAALETLKHDLLSIIRDIQAALDDFDPMTRAVAEVKTGLLSTSKTDEAHFLEWLANNHFIFLGAISVNQGNFSNALGILKQPDTYSNLLNELTITNQSSSTLWLHKSSYASKIDRQEPLDILRITLGKGIEICFVGILTYAAKSISFDQIPYTTNKVSKIMDHLKTSEADFGHKEILTAINHLPFIEMMNLSAEEIAAICTGILTHSSNDTLQVHHRFDPILKQVSVLIYMHHEKLNDSTRLSVKALLAETLKSSILHYETAHIDNDLICVYAILPSQHDPKDEIVILADKIASATLSWSDQFRCALQLTAGLVEGESLYKNYAPIFDAVYKAKYTPEAAAKDAVLLESLYQNNTSINLELYNQTHVENGYQFNLKFFKETTPFALFELFTLLDSLQLKLISEVSFQVSSPSKERTYWIHDLVVHTSVQLDFDCISASFKELCQKILANETSNDELNSLAITEGFNYRQITLVKGFLSYLKQIQFPFGGKYNRDILLKNTSLSATIVRLFEAKFSPVVQEDQRFHTIESLTVHFEQLLKDLKSEDEDKLFRHLYNLVTYILRTNYYVIDELTGEPKSFISFKIDSKHIIDLPLPAPMVEVFVYSKEFEATHLRCGKIARGGIRWSDRGEDYRTEVLGLVKAQNTKNAVIVPMGSKGGFYIKKPTSTVNDAVECYKNMMRGLLDITDNLVDGNVINPKNVIRYDENDPYLVVAADKGTASFSDIANSISAEYNFWLKDAFASGGSAGYDHKKMAITSRGAWESVKQHFKETLNIDPENHPITAVGVGDMSGDVFGNGLLRSKTILLKAAFNHQHIFLDPTPDAEISFNERQRLFNLPRSTWADYSTAAMSKGAMIIERSSKIVDLTPEAQKVLGLSKETVRPSEIMQAILKSDVDLMWLGGIGTYIKAASETDDAVADRANDAIRINGQDVRAKIIAEGANLGCTQKGRIEYASTRNGRVNTDFIDNSGGVDCSDHEVNIKILLNQIVHDGNLTLEDRNSLLKQMTPKIGTSVTSENILQNLALSYAAHYSAPHLNEYAAITQYLSIHAGLNAVIEFLPTPAEFNERQKLQQGLTRPELSVLLSYTKNHLKTELLTTTILDHDYFKTLLIGYFPSDLEKYTKEIESHPLRREIIATKLASEVVDRLGIHFIHRLSHQTGKSISDILAAYIVIKDFFNLTTLWSHVDNALPNLTYDDRIDIIHAISDTVYNACAWMLTYANPLSDIHLASQGLTAALNALQSTHLLLSGSHECIIPTSKNVALREHISGLQKRLTALHLSTFDTQFSSESLTLFEQTYTYLQSKFNFDVLNQILKTIPNTHFWGQLFVLGTQLELQYLHAHLTNSICVSILTKQNTLDNIIKKHEVNVEWLSHMIQQTMTNTAYDPAAVTVITRHLESLINSIIKDLENHRWP